jgi:serine/threonine protein phosphatase PrpC
MKSADKTKSVTWAVGTQALSGESCSGDRHLVCETLEGVLVAVVDGLGHGVDAASAAVVATTVLEENATKELVSLVLRCHEKLRLTRGVVMSVAFFSVRDKLLHWIGVGNVGGLLLSRKVEIKPKPLILRTGVVGQHLPFLQSTVVPVEPGDTLILTTDGIYDEFADSLARGASPNRIAESILPQYSKGFDDALVLVARFQGDDGP